MLQCKTKWKKSILSNLSTLEKGVQVNGDLLSEKGLFPVINGGIEPSGYYDKYNREPNTITISEGGNSCGFVNYMNVSFWSGGHCYTLANVKDIDVKYLYHFLKFQEHNIMKLRLGSGLPNIQRKDIENFKIVFFEENNNQQKIADILSTCDEVIEKTEETIEKYKQIKAGMMQDLFTRGLDENGKLRPTYAQNPDLYKYSKELDRHIPKEWDVKNLSILGEFKNGLNKEKKCFGHGTKFVNIIDAYKEYLDIGSLDRVETNNNDLLVYSLKNNDLIFVRSSVKPEGVGYNTIFLGADEPVVYCGFMIRFRLYESDNINAQFLNYYFRSDYFRRALIAKSTVSANTNINQDSLNQLYTILPKKKEQNKIVDIIDNMNKNISFEEQYLNKYKQIKQGLMKRLLKPPADAEIVEE